MGVWTGLKWVAREATGAGVQQRMVRLIMGRRGRIADWSNILRQFLGSAEFVVTKYGPAWASKDVWGRPVGAWFLLLCWFAPIAAVALGAIPGVCNQLWQ